MHLEEIEQPTSGLELPIDPACEAVRRSAHGGCEDTRA